MTGKRTPGIPDVLARLMEEMEQSPSGSESSHPLDEALREVKARTDALKGKDGADARRQRGQILMEALATASAKTKPLDAEIGKASPPIAAGSKPVLDLPDKATLQEGPVELLVERYATIAAAAHQAIESGKVTRY
ncbi:MAG: hypothetical protein FJX54_20275 [Alphaproteobacteria bacterium]|nr:hypothetical protein [Alphaproteobacteria bacterium]